MRPLYLHIHTSNACFILSRQWPRPYCIIVLMRSTSNIIVLEFLSSANEVSTGPTCQFLSFCLRVFPVFFSRRLIGSYTGFWQWFWQPTYPSRCSELRWAVPHSDFLARLSSATLKNSISGVSSRISMRSKASLVDSSSRLKRRPQKWRRSQKWGRPQKKK